MLGYIVDFGMVAVLIVILTALMGSISGGVAHLLGRKKDEFVTQGERFQTGWKKVGGGHK